MTPLKHKVYHTKSDSSSQSIAPWVLPIVGDAPLVHTGTKALAAPSQIHQAVMNLCTKARQANTLTQGKANVLFIDPMLVDIGKNNA